VASAYGWVTIVILSMVKRAHPSYSNSWSPGNLYTLSIDVLMDNLVQFLLR
jgi:hypothetical protein